MPPRAHGAARATRRVTLGMTITARRTAPRSLAGCDGGQAGWVVRDLREPGRAVSRLTSGGAGFGARYAATAARVARRGAVVSARRAVEGQLAGPSGAGSGI